VGIPQNGPLDAGCFSGRRRREETGLLLIDRVRAAATLFARGQTRAVGAAGFDLQGRHAGHRRSWGTSQPLEAPSTGKSVWVAD